MNLTHEELREIRQKDLPSYLEQDGVSLKKLSPTSFKGRCPFHEDKNPSFNVNLRGQTWLWHCFGCEKGGDLVRYVMLSQGVSFPEAVEILLGKRKNGEEPSVQDRKALKATLIYYHETLKDSKKAQDYLASRGLFDPQLVKEYGIGFSDGSLPRDPELLPALKRLGIVTEKGGEHFRNCLVFPIESLDGEIVSLYGRNISSPQHLYLKGPHRGVFNARAVKGAKRIFITEGIIDCLSLVKLGLKETISLYGTNGFTEDHRKLLQSPELEEVYLCLDNDEAGKEATMRLKEKIPAHLRLFKVNLPEGIKDPNEFLLKGKTKEELLTSSEELRASLKERQAAGWTIEEKEMEILFHREGRTYRIRGLALERVGQLKIALRLTTREGMHLDQLDLYQARSRESFAKMSQKLLGIPREEVERELRGIVAELEVIQVRRLEAREGKGKVPFVMSEEEKKEALQYGRDPNLIERIITDAKMIGHVGEEENFLLGYLVSVSRKLAQPLALFIVSQSAAGKTALQDRILFLTPPEDYLKLTRLTDHSLFYQEKEALRHKLIAIEEEEGASGAGYSIRHLLSAQGLTTMTTIKDEATGKLVSISHEVRGPVAMMITTTHSEINYETYNRFLLVTVDETPRQTQEILAAQRKGETLEGVIQQKSREALQRLHHNFQRLLRPLEIVNPHAEKLLFRSSLLRARREQVKYHSLIKAVSLLRQFQKEVKTAQDGKGGSFEYIEVDTKDIEIANSLAREILKKALDEMTPQARRLLRIIRELVEKIARQMNRDPLQVVVSRREIREYSGWSDYQLRKQIAELVELEYLIPVTGRPGKRFTYLLAWEGEEKEEGEILLPRL